MIGWIKWRLRERREFRRRFGTANPRRMRAALERHGWIDLPRARLVRPWFAILLVVGGCWRECPPPRVVELRRIIVRPAEVDCTNLQKLIGAIPQPAVASCANSADPDDYWYCRAIVNERHADALSAWIARAIEECTP